LMSASRTDPKWKAIAMSSSSENQTYFSAFPWRSRSGFVDRNIVAGYRPCGCAFLRWIWIHSLTTAAA
jgi:hypothetical protein